VVGLCWTFLRKVSGNVCLSELRGDDGAVRSRGEAANWFGHWTPSRAGAPEVAGRQWDYPSGYNLSTLPRPYEPITFSTLRGLADGYDLLRLVIETRKDQAARQS